MKIARYRKAIASALSGVVGLAALFIPGIRETVSPEMIGAVSTVAATALVYAVPNG